MPRPRVLFVLADGARARFVERSPETGYFVTLQEIDSRQRLQTLRQELRASPPARTLEPGSSGHALGDQDFFRAAKEAFAAEVAERAAALVAKRSYQGVFLAAPGRLIGVLRRGLAGRAAIMGELNRDLTKAPDAELAKWLQTPSMAALI